MHPPGTSSAFRFVILVLHVVVTAAMVLATVSGVKLWSEVDSGLFALRLELLESPGWSWLAHRLAAAVIVLAGTAYAALLLARAWPVQPAQDLLAALRAGDGSALPIVNRRLRRTLLIWGGAMIGSGVLLAVEPWPDQVQAGIEVVHAAAAGGLIVLGVLHGVVAMAVRAKRPGSEMPPGTRAPADAAAADAEDLAGPVLTRGAWRRAQALGMYLTGCVLFSLGVKLFIDADLGTDPFGAMAIGIEAWIDAEMVHIGAISSTLALVLLAVWSGLMRRLPPLSTLVTMALVGHLIDLWNVLEVEAFTEPLLAPVPMMLLGLFLDAYASALIIMSGIGIRAVDLVALALSYRWKWRFMEAKLLVEGGFFAVAWLAGGPLGIATVAFVVVVGPFIEPFYLVNRHLLSLPNAAYPEVRRRD